MTAFKYTYTKEMTTEEKLHEAIEQNHRIATYLRRLTIESQALAVSVVEALEEDETEEGISTLGKVDLMLRVSVIEDYTNMLSRYFDENE